MCACMCACVYACIFICMCVCVCVCVCARARARTHAYPHVSMYVCMSLCEHSKTSPVSCISFLSQQPSASDLAAEPRVLDNSSGDRRRCQRLHTDRRRVHA